MAIREIKQGDRGCMSVGSVGREPTSKRVKLHRLIVSPGEGFYAIRIGYREDGKVNDVVLNLYTDAALELVKGILLNVSDVSIAVDDELREIVRAACQRSDEDATAVVECLKRRN